MGHERISRESLFMNIAMLMAKRSTCLRGQVGCIITIDNRIISSGYNGPLKGLKHCDQRNCELLKPCVRAVHAEANAIYAAARNGIELKGAVLYCTHRPCDKCLQAISASGITEVWFIYEYETDKKTSDAVIQMFIEAGVELHKFDESNIRIAE